MKRISLLCCLCFCLCFDVSRIEASNAEDKGVNRFFRLGLGVATCMVAVKGGDDTTKIASESRADIEDDLVKVGAPNSVRILFHRYIKSIVDNDKTHLESQMISLVNDIADHGKREYGEAGYHATLFGMWAGMVTIAIALRENPEDILKAGRDFIPWLEQAHLNKTRKILDVLLDYKDTNINRSDFSKKIMTTLYTLIQTFSL